jgi:hypothetical protein
MDQDKDKVKDKLCGLMNLGLLNKWECYKFFYSQDHYWFLIALIQTQRSTVLIYFLFTSYLLHTYLLLGGFGVGVFGYRLGEIHQSNNPEPEPQNQNSF